MIDNESDLIWESYISEASEYSDDEYPITIVKQDNHHDYTTVNGVRYELAGGDAKEEPAYISDIENTEGNEFYPDHIERYKEYIQNGGVLHTFPVQDISDSPSSLEEMLTNLENSNYDDDWQSSNYWRFQDKHHIDHERLDELIENARDIDTLDEDDPDEAQMMKDANEFIEWVEEWYSEEKDEAYHLTDHNHRFEALKQLGITTVMVDID